MFTLSRFPVGTLSLQVAASLPAGPPLLLLHGVLRGWRDFASIWPAFVPRWQVLALDHRGHGGSDRCSGQYLVRDYADDLIHLLDNQFPAGVILLGHSLGALVAIAAAAQRPDRVHAVVLEDPPAEDFLSNVAGTPWHAVWSGMRPLAGRSAPVRDIARALAEVRQPVPSGTSARLGDLRDPASIRFSARCLKEVDPQVFDPLLASRWLDGFDLATLSTQVRCPALLLRGDTALGGMLTRHQAEQLVGRMDEGMLAEVSGVGHLIHAQATEATLRLVVPFLESI